MSRSCNCKIANVCVDLGSGCKHPAIRMDKDGAISFIDSSGDITSSVVDWMAGDCNQGRSFIDTCFLPDQYAIQWSWASNGDVTSYNALTGETTYWGQTAYGGSTVGGYALAFKNDTVDPTLFFQVGGNLYKASPDDPIGTFTLVGSTAPATSSYPCLDFDPNGRLLLGDGNKAWEVDPVTGAAVFLGDLIDVRDGANLQVGPGDWFFDPNGTWLMMAKDIRGASFLDVNGNPYCTGTAVWQIDSSTLEATRISISCSPVNGTGASWLNASQYLLSVGTGQVYAYNKYTDSWGVFYNADVNNQSQNVSINDLAAQWIIPDPIRIFGWVDGDCEDMSCTHSLFTLVQQPDFTFTCEPWVPTLPGKLGVCEKKPNPYVNDPFDPASGGSGCERCPDEDWHEGCSDAGATLWRRSYDSAGNLFIEYIYGTLTEPVTMVPPGFTMLSCEDAPNPTCETTQWCTDDVLPPHTVFRKECNDGSVIWYDETGTITEPVSKYPGQCLDQDPLLPVTEQVICYEGATYVRVRKETYVEDANGLPVLDAYQIIYYNNDGTLWDSGVIPAGDPVPAGEPAGWYLGDCASNFIDYRIEKLCETDDEKLLLIDSGGAFAEYSFYDGSVIDINTLTVPSAGSGADFDNFLSYAVTSGSNLQVTDVNTKAVISTTPLFTNDGSPLSFSAASFNMADGFLYTASGSNLYRIDVNTAEVSLAYGPFSSSLSGGASLAINPVDGKFYVGGSGGTIRELDLGALTVTTVFTSAGQPNGLTFDANGYLYVGSSSPNGIWKINLNTLTEEQIVADWAPGINSLAYYRTVAQQPSCFYRRFGILANGTWEYLSDHYVSDFSPRIVAGAVTCCECSCGGGSGSGSGGAVTIANATAQHTNTTGTNSVIPAGFASVTIKATSGNVVVNGYPMTNGEVISFNATQLSDLTGSLPAFNITGTSWAWTALNVINS